MSKKRKNSINAIPLIVIVAIVAAIAYYAYAVPLGNDTQMYGDKHYDSLEYVHVSNASLPQQVIVHKAYITSFNNQLLEPNWVGRELLGINVNGDIPRERFFTPDPEVIGNNCDHRDYSKSGYDRGHMAPAGDMKWDKTAMQESFYLSNICPQNPSLNAGTWKLLEESCRQTALRDSAIVIVCGPIFEGSEIQRIGANGVAVPTHFFKAIISPYAAEPFGIAYVMKNVSSRGSFDKYAVSIDALEKKLGYDFFSSLPDELENKLEQMCNSQCMKR